MSARNRIADIVRLKPLNSIRQGKGNLTAGSDQSVQATTKDLKSRFLGIPSISKTLVPRIKELPQSDQRPLEPRTAVGGIGGMLLKSFSLGVLAPSAIALAYFAFFASDVFVSEAKLTVRDAIQQSSGKDPSAILGQLGLSSASNTTQDSMIILDYLKSRAVINDIGGAERIASVYDRAEIDWLSRLGSQRDTENIWIYWKDHVTASVDSLSSILTLRVRAYSPEDSLQLAEAVITQSENLINRISKRSKQDALTRAEDEVKLAAQSLAEARSNMLSFQTKIQTIDPTDTAKQVLKIISSLTIQKVAIENELATTMSLGITNKPGVSQLKARLAAVSKQIADLNAKLAGTSDPETISTQLRDFELLKLQEEFSEYIYKLARNGFENARQNLERQQLYVAVIVPPTLPERALYPKPFVNTALIFAGLTIIWGIFSLMFASVRDSMS
ncbi:hypothetical protein HT585_13100 [Ensifer sp. HO-A22]|uniref:Capsule biosynthesis protein n=1 Tax=Ensifer oleiphilus TaxID=2742698 RepID=A0A7Y6UNN1_9HYPH|nr:hypothetical protein [Ensifer oleiphilus]NVD39798.1 hypothetical protein [Ensifer oleiphilus]